MPRPRPRRPTTCAGRRDRAMDRDRLSLCVRGVLHRGATEIPRIDAPAHPDLLRAFAVNFLNTARPAGTSPALFGTPFGPGFLSPSCPPRGATPIPANASAKPRPARIFFSDDVARHTR